MFIVRKISLILSSAVLMVGIVACSGTGGESLETNESAEAVESIAAEDALQSETSDVVEKATGITICSPDELRCELTKEELEDRGNVCRDCVLGGSCGEDVYTLFCDVP
jgi:hypothetical protein